MSSSLAVSSKKSSSNGEQPSVMPRSSVNNNNSNDPRAFTIELSENEPVKSSSKGGSNTSHPMRPSLKMAKSDNFQKQIDPMTTTSPMDITPVQTERSTGDKELVNMDQVNQKLLDPPNSPNNNNNNLVLGDLSNVAMKSRNSSMTMASSQFSSTNSSRIHSPNKQMMIAGGQNKSDKSVKQNYQEPSGQLTEKDKIRVVVRIRPINEIEMGIGEQEIISCDQNSMIVEGKNPRKFFFDTVFDPTSSQEEVFTYSGVKRLINSAIDGYISTCFAYGQTGSGKTYTMVGPTGAYNMTAGDRYNHFGLIPRSINYLFDQLRQRTQDSKSVFYIRVSYFEIYNEQIRDLINPNSNRKLEIRGSQEEGFFVDNLFATYIETMDEMLTILQEGDYNRATASHMLNEHSSRSHAILTIQIENELQNSDDPKEQITKLGKLIFVDLAGSEKVKVSLSKGKQLVETNNINKSLLVLGNCISALSDPNKKDGHIPYRDSKLTKLLSESLGGTGITLMIANVSPSSSCESETLSTLRYANRAQNIENVPLMKTDSRENIIQKLKRELRKLKEENHTLKTQLGVTAVNTSTANSGSLLSVGGGSVGTGRLPRLARNGSSHSNASTDSTLYNKLQEYMHENKTLRTENSQLEKFREKVRKQHEVLTRENEKLARQLEKVLRDQGQPVKIVQSPGEYVVVNGTPPTNTNGGGRPRAGTNNVSKANSTNHLNVNSSQLPPIEKQVSNATSGGSDQNSMRSNSPKRNNNFVKSSLNGSSGGGGNSKKVAKSTVSDPGENSTVEEIVVARPSYSRKFKDIQDYKVKHLNSDPNMKKSNNGGRVEAMQY